MKGNGVIRKIILTIGVILLVAEIVLISLGLNNKISISLFGGKEEAKSEAFVLMQDFNNDGTKDVDLGEVPGEIVIGGVSTKKPAYSDGAYINGYCVDKGIDLYGTYVSHKYLQNQGSAYNQCNAKAGCEGQMRWLFDNILRVNLTTVGKVDDPRYIKADETNYYRQNLKNILVKQGKSADILDKLSDTHIYSVQQYVFWQYVNHSVQKNITPPWVNSTTDARADLYSALIVEANQHAGYTSNGQQSVTIQKGEEYGMVQEGNDVLVGPFNVNNSNSIMYLFNSTNFSIGTEGNMNEAQLGTNLKIFQADKTTEILNNTYTNYNGKIYAKIYNYSLTGFNKKYVCTGSISATTYKTNAIFWRNSANNVQPVITFGREPNVQNFSVNTSFERKGEVDLALKKMINKVDDVSVTEGNGFNVDRHSGWTINTTPLINGANNAKYLMNKTPVEVQKGQVIDYQICIFNEGQVPAKALEINDYLPVGLKLEKVFYKDNIELTTNLTEENHYAYNEEKGVIIVTLGGADLINAFDGETISKDYITVKCSVKEDATGILTNVSEIRKYQTENGEINVDRDSTSDNWISPDGESRTDADKGSEEWRNYSNNQDSWLDEQWHVFVAQDNGVDNKKGDDDDFEKVKVMEQYKLTIKKVDGSGTGIDNVKFNITKRTFGMNSFLPLYDEEVLTNVSTNNSEIEYVGNISYNSEAKESLEDEYWPYASYVIEEVQDQDLNMFQLEKPITIAIMVKDGKVNGYNFNYGGNSFGGIRQQSETFDCLLENGLVLKAKVILEGNNITVEIQNVAVVNGRYGIKFRKISSGDGKPLQGVTFSAQTSLINIASGEETDALPVQLNATDAQGYTNTVTEPISNDSAEYIDKYVLKEIDLGSNSGYTRLDSDITIKVFKKQENAEYKVDHWEVNCDAATREIKPGKSAYMYITENGIKYKIDFITETVEGTPVLTVVVPNAPDNKINLQIRKVSDEDGTTVIKGTSYKVMKNDTILYEDIDTTGEISLTDSIEASITSIEYNVEEVNAASKYDNIFANKNIKVQVTLVNGVPTAATAKVYNKDGTENTDLTAKVAASVVDISAGGNPEKAVDLLIKNPPTVHPIDLALKKVITEVNNMSDTTFKEVKSENGFDAKFDRVTESSTKVRIDTTPLKNGGTNAEYYLNKTPVEVLKGSSIRYQIRIYNEGADEAATASEITDYIPNGLTFKNIYYKNQETALVADTDYTYDEETNVLKIKALKNKALIPVYDGGDSLSYDYVTVECEVTGNAKDVLTNVAEISEYKTADAVIPQDRDSVADDWKNPVDRNSDNNETVDRDSYYWINYAGYINNKIEDGAYKNYIGQQDDDDFEKIKIVDVDLVLKKVITKVNDTDVNTMDAKFKRFQDGEIEVYTKFMDRFDNITTSDYYMNKTPVIAKINDLVTYQIRIYNEGSIDATACSIADYIPKGMTFVSATYNNNELVEGTDYTINEENVLIVTAMKNHFIPKYTGSFYNTVLPSYDYITVTCKINGENRGILTNVAEITKYQIPASELFFDRDSSVTGKYGLFVSPTGSNKVTLEGKSGSTWANYRNSSIIPGKFLDYPGQEDDDDFEKVQVATNYTLQVQKVSAIGSKPGLANVEINVNDQSYTTDNSGKIAPIGPFEVTADSEEDEYVIEEIATNNDKFVKLYSPIYFNVVKSVSPDGYVYISGYKINTIKEITEGIDIERLENTSYYALDENYNLVHVNLTFDRDNSSGLINIKFVIENTIDNVKYNVKIQKVDQSGNNVDGVKFNINGKINVTTEDGIAVVGESRINMYNYDEPETFSITEVLAPSDYYLLKDKLDLIVNKGISQDGLSYEVKSLQLQSGEQVSEAGKDITLQNVDLVGNKKVNITAKLEGNVITITIPNTEKEFDLALRKFITRVNRENVSYSREPVVNIDNLKNGTSTNAVYEHTKEPLEVMASDIVEYTIRVYNEGQKSGYAELVMDDIPDGLEMVTPEIDKNGVQNFNASFRWKMYKETNEAGELTYNNKDYVETTIASEAQVIVSDYLSSEQSRHNCIRGFDQNTMAQLDSRDIRVEFKVKETAPVDTVITNYAQITEDSNENNQPVVDRDSTPNEWIETDDDQDIEKIIVTKEKEFDLALQKFITAVTNTEGTKEITDRVPVFSKDTSVTEGDGYKYSPKFEDMSAVNVNTNDIVTYTIRVYNEGESDAYAAEITDDIPEGIEFVPYTNGDGSVNDTYRWLMYKKVTDEEIEQLGEGIEVKQLNGVSVNGEVKYDKCIITDDPKEADYVVSDYLSKEQGQYRMSINHERINSSLLFAFEPTNEEKLAVGPAYKDIKVQFKVTYTSATKEQSNKEIVNSAQITKETDRTDNDVTDRDSTQNVWIDKEDDQDKEKIRVKYFDLSLVKWVSEAIVIEDGVEKVTPGNNFEDLQNKYDHRLIYAMNPDKIGDYTDLEPVIKVDIPKNKLDSTVVKFKYQIRVFNEGQIDGYAKEITDYIPAGMKFVQEDNPLWEDVGDGKVITTQLADKILTVGGEAQTVEIVYTWINSQDNLGLLVNMAEISKDYNESNAPDIDSTPNNIVPNEDDIDDAAVLISVRTGEKFNSAYIVLAISVIAVIGSGTVLIKKYVL